MEIKRSCCCLSLLSESEPTAFCSSLSLQWAGKIEGRTGALRSACFKAARGMGPEETGVWDTAALTAADLRITQHLHSLLAVEGESAWSLHTSYMKTTFIGFWTDASPYLGLSSRQPCSTSSVVLTCHGISPPLSFWEAPWLPGLSLVLGEMAARVCVVYLLHKKKNWGLQSRYSAIWILSWDSDLSYSRHSWTHSRAQVPANSSQVENTASWKVCLIYLIYWTL